MCAFQDAHVTFYTFHFCHFDKSTTKLVVEYLLRAITCILMQKVQLTKIVDSIHNIDNSKRSFIKRKHLLQMV